MRRYIDQVKHMDYFVEKAQSMAALRNSLALALQCTGVEITGSYVTNTGKSALKMLKDPEFSSLKAMIMGSSGKDLTYSDLRKFVIGMELEKYFSKSRSEKLYARLGKDRYFLHTDHNFVRDSLGGVSSVVIEVDTDFENIKGELVRIMNGYISSYKLSLFGHHHNKRAIAVKTAVLSCCTLEEITAIIENQRSIFAKPLIVDEPGLIASFKLETEGKGSLKASDEIKDIPLLRTRWKSVRNVSSSSGYRKMLEAAWSFVSAKSLVVDPLTVGVVPS